MLLPGTSLFDGRYIVDEKLGSGGFGITYLVREKDSQSKVVIKLLHGNRDEKLIMKEADMLYSCNGHSNICKFKGVLREESLDTLCLIMEYVEGSHLAEYVENKNGLDEDEALKYIQQIGEALLYAHKKNIIHRDVSPSNIILRLVDGQPSEAVLIDFGVARESSVDRHTVASNGHYTPLEQYNDKAYPQSDLYALAATFYEILTYKSHLEKIPSSQERRDAIKKTHQDPLIPPHQINSNISKEMGDIILQGMELDYQKRLSLENWLASLRKCVHVRSEQPIRTSIPPEAWRYTQLSSILTGHTKPIYAVTCLPDGKTVVSASQDRTIRLWNLESGQLSSTLNGHSETVFCLAVSPDGKTLASGDFNYKINIWNLETSQLKTTLSGHPGQVLSVGISSDGKLLVSSSVDGTIKVWDLETERVVLRLKNRIEQSKLLVRHINSLVVHNDKIINGFKNGMIKIWCLETGRLLSELSQSGNSPYRFQYVNSVTISSDGKIAISNDREQIYIWDLECKRFKKILSGHRGFIHCVAISPDDRTLASCGEDGTIKLWNLKTGELICTLALDEEPIYCVTFGWDGKILISAGRSHTIQVWKTSYHEIPVTLSS